ncbi:MULTISPECIES: aldo/keto reductase [Actinoalloteichus]|uniref:Oxidoreductase, aryl-alcohol dehydrogenase like protein n=1 Tax=Actinoalloteichus fjordicus TaxID=1612552 RepID=A0AAC9LC12_9PSEU|nr:MULTISPECIES: aldo/keto reductase [Actinoalloteichus]APU13574.1 putative oxidoreductase, aryl-alcohol dehydrogenase like protein [Actinoalloteichus fjordicus]APU19521.1 putative oxidoreductase, aryl-alcohol dehydrogenase like protein [Actinoalloteichus sp. GBA129-24]
MTQQRRLGTDGPAVSPIGYGAMVLLDGMYGTNDDANSAKVLAHVLDQDGPVLLDTADAYGANGENEQVLGLALAGRRDRAVVGTKWGIVYEPSATANKVTATYANSITVDARPERAGAAIDASLRRLGIDAVDLWYLHFPDPGVPVVETVAAMAEQVTAGKAAHLGLCNVTGEQLRAAHAVHPIAAVQVEWSLWTRDVEADLIPVARELGVGIVPWGPLGTGFLAGSADTIGAGDFRNNAPRFAQDNLTANRDRFAPLAAFAERKGISRAQLALAWLLAQGEDVVPIPGTTKPHHIDDNLGAAHVSLSAAELAELDGLAPKGLASGPSLLDFESAAH